MDLQDEFRELGFEMARFIKQELDKMNDRYKNTIKFIETETEKKIKKDLIKIEKKMVQDAEFGLNRKESELINEINQLILDAKSRYVSLFVKKLKKTISEKIKQNQNGYFEFLLSNLEKYAPLVKENARLNLNGNDLKTIQNNVSYKKRIPSQITLSDIPIEIVGGFKIYSKEFELDFTISNLIEQKKDEISMKFMEIFPIFEINVENAMEIYEKIHQSSMSSESDEMKEYQKEAELLSEKDADNENENQAKFEDFEDASKKQNK